MTKIDVEKCMADLNGKKSEGFDRIPVCCLFDACESLLNPMANLYEKIYDTGTIPEQWKFSKIIPTFKKGSKTENYMIVFLYENFSRNLDCNFSLSRICAYSLSLSLSLSLSPTHTLSLSLSPPCCWLAHHLQLTLLLLKCKNLLL